MDLERSHELHLPPAGECVSRFSWQSGRICFTRGLVMRADWRLVGYLAVQGLVTAGSFALPGFAGGAVRLAIAAAGILGLVGAIVRRRPARPVGWWLLALGGAFSYAASVVIAGGYDGTGSGELLGSVGQIVLGILALCALAAGLGVLGWRTVGSRGWD